MPVPADYAFPLPFDNEVGMDAFRDVPKSPFLEDVDDDFKKLNCYKGNQSLKGNNVKVPMTQAHIDEFKRCKNDIFYFLINYGKIISLNDGEINFGLYQYQKNMIKLMDENRFVVNLLPRQMGKAVDGETPILTSNGFKQMKDIQVGDKVYDPNGNLVNVISTTGPQYDRVCYEIEFSNGEIIVADENHEWKFNDTSMKKVLVRNTQEFLKRFEVNKRQGQSVNIPHPKLIEFEEKDVLIKPYDLGVWLGDGYSDNNKITTHIDDYREYIKFMDLSDYVIRKSQPNCVDFRFESFSKNDLKELDLLSNKHIPDEYIFNSKEVRIQLIQGLMDTDGSIEKNGVCRFYQSNKNIVDDFRFILSSLGIKSTLGVKKHKKYKTAYTVHFICNDFDVVKLPRKLERQYNNLNHSKNKKFFIKKYKKVESRPVYCITVDSEDHLFLIGKSLIPTHNCTEKNTMIKIRNRKTGEIIELTVEEFYELSKNKKSTLN